MTALGLETISCAKKQNTILFECAASKLVMIAFKMICLVLEVYFAFITKKFTKLVESISVHSHYFTACH